MTQRRYSSLLEIEAADYFKLDLSQVHMFNRPVIRHQSPVKRRGVACIGTSRSDNHKTNVAPVPKNHLKQDHVEVSTKRLEKKAKFEQTNVDYQKSDYDKRGKNDIMQADRSHSKGNQDFGETSRLGANKSTMQKKEAHSVMATSPYLADSSTASTNSLPSISSSPSVSPSLVCPHLSLDDILSRRIGSKSPHTIGLCSKCRLDPPPNVHSPLSPAFKPSKRNQLPQSGGKVQREKKEIKPLRRGYSDQQVSARSAGRLSAANRAHEDSLDYYLEPSELRRLQMSPTLRNSVEFIRNNTTEAGRVLRIYKNGEPFEKPLRICVSRGEFATLNNLLDFIASRQLIPSGARYLFHLDGQLVYSVNELKHGSIYIVSGSRKFDHRANSILKEQYKREIQSPQTQHRRSPSQLDTTRPLNTMSQPQRSVLPQPSSGMSKLEHHKLHPSKENLRGAGSTVKQKNALDGFSQKNDGKHVQDDPKKVMVLSKDRKGTVRDRLPKEIGEHTNIAYDRQGPHKKGTRTGSDNRKHESSPASNSNDNLTTEQKVSERPVSLVRAKSELGASPSKRKKNVTFVDWSSNYENVAQSEKSLNEVGLSKELADKELLGITNKNGLASESMESSLKELSTSEIGIQVSDSIEGFLIDLPIPLPPKGDEAKEKRSYLRKGQGAKVIKGRQTMPANKNSGSPAKTTTASKQATAGKSRPQVVTITERQLSLDEMDQLKDLDHGDHHSEAHKIQHVTITLDGASDVVASDDEQQDGRNTPEKGSGTVVVCDPRETINIGQEDKTGISKSSTSGGTENDENNWQYPEGRQSNATPIERPISQSEANESVHARVTTPTPSLSTNGGDSISMSHDSTTAGMPPTVQSELPSKRIVPVCGRTRRGVDPPDSNFVLKWVNGFAINDQYPENSTMLGAPVTDPTRPDGDSLLSPTQPNQRASSSAFQFKPVERFNNWICYSRRHDELVYPVGVLIVLWCKRTNEQRYYSKHDASVCCVALGSVDEDLAASGQVSETGDKITAAVHLWSLVSLDTLQVVDGEPFLGKRILSMKVRNSSSEGCEVSVAARDEKRIWVYVFYLNLKAIKADDMSRDVPNSSGQIITVMKANKPLQANQTPLILVRVSNQMEMIPVPVDSSKQPTEDLLITFGRRHFQVWFADRRQRKLRLLSMEKKNPNFVELVVKANCLARMSPVEYLVGDTNGNITLLQVNTQIKPNSKFNLSSKLTNDDKYTADTIPLYVASQETALNKLNPITCLTRISGSIFASGDSTCTVKFWQIDRKAKFDSSEMNTSSTISRLLNCICLPPDLGFICAIILSKYHRKQSTVEFYVVSTSNAILFGSIQLQSEPHSSTPTGNISVNSSLSVVYEGHESFAISLVADCPSIKTSKYAIQQEAAHYFTCSLDYKICKWSGKNLVWKSVLPSACASLAVHRVGFVLAVGSADGTVYIMDKISGLLISYFPLTPVCINCLAYSQDGMLLAAGCANGSIFILPVYERGLKYKKVSIFQSPNPVVSLQFSVDNQYLLTSVTNGLYQELILWDLPNFRYMRDKVRIAADKISWFDPTCSGSEDVRAIWENANLASTDLSESVPVKTKAISKRSSGTISTDANSNVVNLSCHRRIRKDGKSSRPGHSLAIASDTNGFLRLFRYPCYDIQQGFYEIRVSVSPVNCCRFLANSRQAVFVSTSLDGSICLWATE